MKRVAYISHPDCLLHDCDGHPENADRLRAVESALVDAGLMDRMIRLEARPATVEEISLCHDRDYVHALVNLKPVGLRLIDPDTYINPHSARAALLAFGCGLLALQKIVHRDIDRAFCAVRPPGHHAEHNRAMGFCLFNNVAGTAAFALEKLNFSRIAIFDFDVHHGNGTQSTFYEDDRVHVSSLHQWPFYPGSGGAHETGKGKGSGLNLNFPLDAGTEGHSALKLVEPVWREAMTAFRPELILVSAGFDAHKDDPLAALRFDDLDFYYFTKMICSVANQYCGGKVISFLEGGYDRDALGRSVVQHVKGLLDE